MDALHPLSPSKTIIYSRDEFKQSQMRHDYSELRFFLGDVRDRDRLEQVMAGVDYVIHAAALKQVPTLEYNPTEAIKTNVDGSVNVVQACIRCGVKRAVLVSTDKAVCPVNLYGSTKLAAEKVFMAANSFNATQFACVRYGNVINSRGSVIPVWQGLKALGVREFPVTHFDMTRFWMRLEEAVSLVVYTLLDDMPLIYVPRIPSMKISDVARAVWGECILKHTGIRPGEKMHESLVSEDNEKVVLVERTAESWAYRQFSPKPIHSNTNDWWLTKDDMRKRL